MEQADTPAATAPPRRRHGCARVLLSLAVLTMLGAGLAFWLFTSLAREGFQWLAVLPERVTSSLVTESLRQSVTEIASTSGDVLEVATLQTDETVTKSDSLGLFRDTIPLGTTVSEIRAPVIYRYHIRLSGEWRVEIHDGHALVHAPALHPSQPPSIRTEGMEKKSTAGWLRFNAAENLASLERGLTAALEARASSPKNLDLIREKARHSVAAFVRAWLLKDPLGRAAPLKSLTILFPDEKVEDVPASAMLDLDKPPYASGQAPAP